MGGPVMTSPSRVACPECREQVGSSDLRRHVQVHLRYTPFECALCRTLFYSRPDAAAHFSSADSPHPGQELKVIEARDAGVEAHLESLVSRVLPSPQSRTPRLSSPSISSLQPQATPPDPRTNQLRPGSLRYNRELSTYATPVSRGKGVQGRRASAAKTPTTIAHSSLPPNSRPRPSSQFLHKPAPTPALQTRTRQRSVSRGQTAGPRTPPSVQKRTGPVGNGSVPRRPPPPTPTPLLQRPSHSQPPQLRSSQRRTLSSSSSAPSSSRQNTVPPLKAHMQRLQQRRKQTAAKPVQLASPPATENGEKFRQPGSQQRPLKRQPPPPQQRVPQRQPLPRQLPPTQPTLKEAPKQPASQPPPSKQVGAGGGEKLSVVAKLLPTSVPVSVPPSPRRRKRAPRSKPKPQFTASFATNPAILEKFDVPMMSGKLGDPEAEEVETLYEAMQRPRSPDDVPQPRPPSQADDMVGSPVGYRGWAMPAIEVEDVKPEFSEPSPDDDGVSLLDKSVIMIDHADAAIKSLQATPLPKAALPAIYGPSVGREDGRVQGVSEKLLDAFLQPMGPPPSARTTPKKPSAKPTRTPLKRLLKAPETIKAEPTPAKRPRTPSRQTPAKRLTPGSLRKRTPGKGGLERSAGGELEPKPEAATPAKPGVEEPETVSAPARALATQALAMGTPAKGDRQPCVRCPKSRLMNREEGRDHASRMHLKKPMWQCKLCDFTTFDYRTNTMRSHVKFRHEKDATQVAESVRDLRGESESELEECFRACFKDWPTLK